ncbi:hypothetical protein GCM10025871_15130 [Deinococcus metallilatus]|nr:hypothetical protein GCM10025871_15130 [Deinococcus metallilatus]
MAAGLGPLPQAERAVLRAASRNRARGVRVERWAGAVMGRMVILAGVGRTQAGHGAAPNADADVTSFRGAGL